MWGLINDKCRRQTYESSRDSFEILRTEIKKRRNNSEFLSIKFNGKPVKEVNEIRKLRGKISRQIDPLSTIEKKPLEAGSGSFQTLDFPFERAPFSRNYVNVDDALALATMAARHLIPAIARTRRARPRFRVFRQPARNCSTEPRVGQKARGRRRIERSIATGINYSLFTSECSKR